MPVSRLRGMAILLLALWLTADVGAFGFCGGELLRLSSSGTLGAADDSGGAPPCCTGHDCFCCSSGAEVTTFELSAISQTVLMDLPPVPDAPNSSVSHPSPPPKP